MATSKKSTLEETRQRAHDIEAEEKRIGALDSRTEQQRGDPWRSTVFLLGIVAITLVLCLIVMLFLAAG